MKKITWNFKVTQENVVDTERCIKESLEEGAIFGYVRISDHSGKIVWVDKDLLHFIKDKSLIKKLTCDRDYHYNFFLRELSSCGYTVNSRYVCQYLDKEEAVVYLEAIKSEAAKYKRHLESDVFCKVVAYK